GVPMRLRDEPDNRREWLTDDFNIYVDLNANGEVLGKGYDRTVILGETIKGRLRRWFERAVAVLEGKVGRKRQSARRYFSLVSSTFSPPFRVMRARSNDSSIPLFRKRVVPSTKA